MNISSDRTVTICRSLYRTDILSGFMFSTYRSSVDLRRPEEGGGGEEDIHISGSPPPPQPSHLHTMAGLMYRALSPELFNQYHQENRKRGPPHCALTPHTPSPSVP